MMSIILMQGALNTFKYLVEKNGGNSPFEYKKC